MTNIDNLDKKHFPEYPFPLWAYPKGHPRDNKDEYYGHYIKPNDINIHHWIGYLEHPITPEYLEGLKDDMEARGMKEMYHEMEGDGDVGLYGYTYRTPLLKEYRSQVENIYKSFESQKQSEKAQWEKLRLKYGN